MGSEHPIALQTMTTTDTRDVEGTVEQVGAAALFGRTCRASHSAPAPAAAPLQRLPQPTCAMWPLGGGFFPCNCP